MTVDQKQKYEKGKQSIIPGDSISKMVSYQCSMDYLCSFASEAPGKIVVPQMQAKRVMPPSKPAPVLNQEKPIAIVPKVFAKTQGGKRRPTPNNKVEKYVAVYKPDEHRQIFEQYGNR